MTPAPDVYGLAVELLALAATLVQALQGTGAAVQPATVCAHPVAAREPRGTLGSPWKAFFCRDCQSVITTAKER
jgi:hypothetical protein